MDTRKPHGGQPARHAAGTGEGGSLMRLGACALLASALVALPFPASALDAAQKDATEHTKAENAKIREILDFKTRASRTTRNGAFSSHPTGL